MTEFAGVRPTAKGRPRRPETATTISSLALLALGWAASAACGGRGGSDDDPDEACDCDTSDGCDDCSCEPRSECEEVPAGCDRACAVADDCAGGELDTSECEAGCRDVVSEWGQIGEEGVLLCADCLEAHDCLEIGDGACDSPCAADGPEGFLDLDPESPGGPGCRADWQMEGREWTVTCEPGGDELDCSCVRDGLVGGSFQSLDFCDVADREQLDRANRGCNWSLGLLPGCSVEFGKGSGDDWAGVACVGTAVGWDCECQGPAYATFFSDDFCELDFLGSAERANAECGLELDPLAPCSTTWVPEVTELTVACEDGLCRCLEGGNEAGSFESGEFCIRSIDDRRATAIEACGWAL